MAMEFDMMTSTIALIVCFDDPQLVAVYMFLSCALGMLGGYLIFRNRR